MWSYYGSKSKIVDTYPPPKFGKIIEPFAGSGRYSLKYWKNDVLLVDKFDKVVSVWKYLIEASEKDIMGLPDMDNRETDRISDYNICDAAKWLIGFSIGRGSPVPRNKPGKYNSWKEDKKRIAKDLFKIKHWTVQLGTYDEIPNFTATWFIDPPYQYGGEYYRFSNKQIDFNHLSGWCKERNGQSIVCENTKADWMDFKPMIDMRGSTYETTEAIWSNHKTNFDNVQGDLFSVGQGVQVSDTTDDESSNAA